MSDPFKEMARQYDAAVVAKGGRSIFCRHLRPVVVAIRDGYETPEYIAERAAAQKRALERLKARTKRIARAVPKPQRIMAHTYGILGAGVLSDFDDMGD